ncbi:hypothetical protein [Microcoleus sp. LEGE 07076]|uniref:hypothetical protein n=1 Tax=Microcoleus sp. LEGE 07076 TaxID=915322 RepID=UPI0030DA7DAE
MSYDKKQTSCPIAIMVALPDRPLISAEEYLAWEPTQEERYEYLDGEVSVGVEIAIADLYRPVKFS